MYCTYLTIYSGDKLPPFYIGSTSIERYENGYRGSVCSKLYKDIWNQELKEHPELFDTVVLTEHDTRKEAIVQELTYQKQVKVKTNIQFINMAYAAPNGFMGRPMTGIENPWFNNPIWIGRKQTEEHKTKRAKAIEGDKNGMFGKKHTLEVLEKIGAKSRGENNPMHHSKGRTPPCLGRTEEKHPQFGKHWYHNPITFESICCKEEDKPEGYINGRGKIKNREVK